MNAGLKPIRRRVVKTEAPDLYMGIWTRYAELSCGHRQTISATTYNRVPKTTICNRCTRQSEDQILPRS